MAGDRPANSAVHHSLLNLMFILSNSMDDAPF